MALNKRVFRALKEHGLRYAGVFVLIFLGSYTFVTASGLSHNLASLVNTFTEEHVQEDLSFAADRSIPDIARIEREANAVIEAYLSYDAAMPEGATLRLLSQMERLNLPAVVEGRALAGPGEILLDPAFAQAYGYPVGSQIEAAGRTFHVAGFVSLPHYIYPLKNVYDILPEHFGVGVIGGEDFAFIGEAATVYYSVKFNDRAESLNRQAVQLRELLRGEGVQVSDWADIMNNKRARMVWASITGMQTISVPMPVAMFFLSCLIIGMIIWRAIRQESVIIGTLYAQGYRRRELMKHYMAIPLLLASAGGAAGSLLALPSIGPAVTAMVAYYNVPVHQLEWSIWRTAVGLLAPVLFLGLSSYLVIRSELKRQPAELMKGDRRKTKVNALERALKLERFAFGTKFKLREQLRSVSRLLFLLVGVTGASVLMLFGFTVMNSMNHVLQSDPTEIYGFEYEYVFKELQNGEAPEGAAVFAAGMFYPEDNEGREFYITGIEPDTAMLSLKDGRGHPLPNDQTNMTAPLAKRLGVKAGDSVTLINKEDGKPYTFQIDAIADSDIEQFVFMPIGTFNAKLGLPQDSYIGFWSTVKLDIPDELLSGTKTLSDASGAMGELFGQMVAMVALITAIACIVALIILYLVTSLIVEENRTTISLLKIFGYRRREVRSLILNSSTVVIVVGFLIAVPVMAASMDAMYGYLGDMINLVLPTIINPLHVAVCFVIILLTYQLSKLLCAKKVNAVAMSEALKAGTE